MIDWRSVAGNGLWIFGLSSLLAVAGYYHWLAGVSRQRRADIFKDPAFRFLCSSALCLTAAGWALAQASRWWEKAMLLVVAASWLWDAASVAVSRRKRTARKGADHIAAD